MKSHKYSVALNVFLLIICLFLVAFIAYDSSLEIVISNEINIENLRVRQYNQSTIYDNSDYTYTNVLRYASDGFDQPIPWVVSWNYFPCDMYEIEVCAGDFSKPIKYAVPASNTSFRIYNLIPGQTYVAKIYAINKEKRVVIASDVAHTSGQIRMINIDGVLNVRDIGGWTCAGKKHIKYGLIYRGAALDEDQSHIKGNGIKTMYEYLGIRTEIDLRHDFDHKVSVLGSDCSVYGFAAKSYVKGFNDCFTSAQLFRCIFNSIKKEYPVYIHCSGGADRTAFICCMLECLLGVSESDINKDFELSSFSSISNTNGYRRYRNMGSDETLNDRSIRDWESLMSLIKQSGGGTLQENAYSYFLSAGISKSDLDEFISLMVDDR